MFPSGPTEAGCGGPADAAADEVGSADGPRPGKICATGASAARGRLQPPTPRRSLTTTWEADTAVNDELDGGCERANCEIGSDTRR